MKKVLLLTLLFASVSAVFAYSYDTNLPLPGKSLADENLQKNTLFTAYSFAHRVAPSGCQAFSIIDTNVSSPKENNQWEEIWTIKACSRTADVPITFTVNENGATYAIDPMGVRVTDN